MALPWRETWSMAWSALRASRLRSLLTILGIVIGNASVITLVGIGQGTQRLANEQLQSLGTNVLFVVPGNNRSRRGGAARPRTFGARRRRSHRQPGAQCAAGGAPDFLQSDHPGGWA